MDIPNEMIIKITTDSRILVQEMTGVALSYKEIEPDAFYQCIRHSLRRSMFSSGLLPKGCFQFSMDDQGTRYVAMEFPDFKADISYEKTLYEQFPLPKMVFGFSVSKDGRISNVRLGITENKKITLNSKMYLYPFSNVSDFNVCLGANRMPQVKCLTQLNGIPYYVLSMPNNDDRFSSDRNKLELSSRALFEHLKDKDTAYYYNDVLIESKRTIKDFIND